MVYQYTRKFLDNSHKTNVYIHLTILLGEMFMEKFWQFVFG